MRQINLRENESEEARRIRLEKDNLRHKKRYWERKRDEEDESTKKIMLENQCSRLTEEASDPTFEIECKRLLTMADNTLEYIHLL